MSNARWAAVLAICWACGPRARDPVPLASIDADMPCPPGTWAAGTPPPMGTEAWCELRQPGHEPVRQGPSLTWYPNSKRATEGSWGAGRREGPWLTWHPNGAPATQGTYAHGLEEGLWSAYHPNGERAWEGRFVEGQPDGPWVYWDMDTLTRTEGTWSLGQRTGRWIDLGPDGTPIRKRLYRDGRLVDQQELGR